MRTSACPQRMGIIYRLCLCPRLSVCHCSPACTSGRWDHYHRWDLNFALPELLAGTNITTKLKQKKKKRKKNWCILNDQVNQESWRHITGQYLMCVFPQVLNSLKTLKTVTYSLQDRPRVIQAISSGDPLSPVPLACSSCSSLWLS